MIYFDNAATTYPKPDAVYDRVSVAMREYCGNPGRSSHRLSMLAEREVFACRVAAAEMFSALPENVIFTYNTTYALNMAMKCAYTSGAILISDLEHNSVRRPAVALSREVLIFDSHIEMTDKAERTAAIIASIKERLSHISSDTRVMLVCTAASNVCGVTMPIREIGQFCHENGIFFIVDGAQAGGMIDLNLARDNIDVLCLPGHKGLYGPQGSGMMILGDKMGVLPRTFIEGGNGVNSLDVSMPEISPERYEGGTLAVQTIAGLRAGLEFVRARGAANLRAHEEALASRFAGKLKNKLGGRVKFYADDHRGGIVLFNISGYSSNDVAAYLDEYDVCVRSGFHCSPLAHNRLSTGNSGAVRVSFGAFNTTDEVDEVVELLTKVK
ncbi:MAG: aminotransferase class V-fold PLP-dependent enzyme [Clostridiales bacterium]|nr:aminotransferase class V-fold PLP-dependent enzyme [Clostridiales bacterium]